MYAALWDKKDQDRVGSMFAYLKLLVVPGTAAGVFELKALARKYGVAVVVVPDDSDTPTFLVRPTSTPSAKQQCQ